jgi:transcriptional regulator with XRE-family HTH domain
MSYVAVMFPDTRIRELRKQAGLTQAELGEAVGLHQTQIGNLENGSRNLTLEWARRIARVLDCSVADLLGEDDNPDRLTPEERELIAAYRQASAAQQEILRRVAEPIQPFKGPEEPSNRLAPRKVA